MLSHVSCVHSGCHCSQWIPCALPATALSEGELWVCRAPLPSDCRRLSHATLQRRQWYWQVSSSRVKPLCSCTRTNSKSGAVVKISKDVFHKITNYLGSVYLHNARDTCTLCVSVLLISWLFTLLMWSEALLEEPHSCSLWFLQLVGRLVQSELALAKSVYHMQCSGKCCMVDHNRPLPRFQCYT